MNPSRKCAVEIEIVAISKQGGRRYNEDVYGHWHDGRFVACVVRLDVTDGRWACSELTVLTPAALAAA